MGTVRNGSRLLAVGAILAYCVGLVSFLAWLSRTDFMFGHFTGPSWLLVVSLAGSGVCVLGTVVWLCLAAVRYFRSAGEDGSPRLTVGRVLLTGAMLILTLSSGCVSLVSLGGIQEARTKAYRLHIDELGRQGKSAVPELTKALGSSDWNVRSRAMHALGNVGPEAREAVPALLRILHDDEKSREHETVLETLAKIDADAAREAAREKLSSANPEMRIKAAEILVTVKDASPELHPVLASAMTNSDSRLRAEAARVAGMIGPPAKEMLPELEKMCNDPSAWVRAEAATAVWKISGRGDIALPPLRASLAEKEGNTRAIALKALIAMGPAAKDAVPDLMNLVKTGSNDASEQAMEALGNIGPEARAAVPLLQELRKSGINSTRQAAESALKKIAPDAVPLEKGMP